MKKTILIITTVLLFTGCSFSQSQSNIHYTFGVIETSSARKYTVIKYYNDDGKKVASTKLDEAQVGTSFNTTSYHDGYAYINNIGLQGHKNPQNIIQIKGNSTEVNKLHLPGTAIDAVSADDHYYYGVSNLNDYGYLTQMNFKEKKVNEIKEKSRFSYMVVPSHSKVYNFVDIENDIACDIYDQNLKRLKSISLTQYGDNICKYYTDKDTLYFSFNNQNKYIGQLNMNTDELKIIDMPYSYADNIYVNDGKIYVSFYNLVSNEGNKICVFDQGTHQLEKTYTLNHHLDMIDFNGSHAYILSRNEHDKYSVNIYDYKSDFKQVKRISLPKKKTYNYLIYYSTLFINPSLK